MSLLTQQVRANATTIVGGVGSGGGGGGPDLSVSTLSVNDGGSINMSWNNGGPILSFPYEATNTSSFGFVLSVQPPVPTIAPAQGCMAVVETNGNAQTLSAYAPLLTNGLEIRQQGYPGVQTAALYTSSGNTTLTSVVPIVLDAPNVTTSSITVSSINGVVPGDAKIPADLSVNSLTATANVSAADMVTSTIKLLGFRVPIQQFGATSLDSGGSTVVTSDYTYTDPWYPLACYKGSYSKTLGTLAVSTLGADSFLITGEPGVSVIWQTLGN